MSLSSAVPGPGDDWRQRIADLAGDTRIELARRADAAPLFAHAYAFHLNFRFGGMKPSELADFAHRHGLAGLKIHVGDGEGASLNAMSRDELAVFGRQAGELGLEVHVETSTTSPDGLSDAVARALAVGAASLRCYPLYEGHISQIVSWTIDDLRRLPQYDPGGRLRFTLEQHEDLKSDELVHIVDEVANPNLGLLFDFANMVNAYERPLDALARQAPHIAEVHVKDCLIRPDRGGWAHLACASGHGHLPMHAMLVELLLLGADRPQVRAFGLEEEEGYFAPALRWPGQGEDPFIAARTESFTEPGSSKLEERLKREAAAAAGQVRTVRAMLDDIATEARRHSRQEGGND
ncbi:sugar phosphate isomerase/epimerase family protein [Mesorhizobium sp. SP-1A]|uniref:sugar phosphate isomerase/epimerase family protein n=1 Tax=Mesorhizobium sp. SP-1A TaxID=3077840 RepID=UPI0028F6CCDF|nr:TIM barrel protein [Mesorhizobium sp. SP-1A]